MTFAPFVFLLANYNTLFAILGAEMAGASCSRAGGWKPPLLSRPELGLEFWRVNSSNELAGWLAAAQEAARRGAKVLEDWRRRFTVREKARFDLVTEADFASQQAIRDFLHERYPDHAFLGEESASPGASAPGENAPPTWIVDPLDGTTNYVHDCPLYCVSIGLMVQGELVVGVVFDPSRQEMFRAATGQGAWLEKIASQSEPGASNSGSGASGAGGRAHRLQTSRSDRLEESLLATGFPPDMRGQERALDWWRYFSYRTRSLRRTGSTALNLAYVAAGRFDAYWGFDNHAWDVAGAAVIIREAGGSITTTSGQPFDPFLPDTLASNGPLHPVLLAAFHQNNLADSSEG
jgi:myo-inositol-1(or 4)-monophosphatase